MWHLLLPAQLITASLAAVNATVANTTVIAAGNGMLQLFSGGDWAPVDAAWSFRVFDIRCVTIYYFEPILAWPVYGFVLLAIMCFTVLVGAIVVIAMMTKQRQRTHDYALLDTNVGGAGFLCFCVCHFDPVYSRQRWHIQRLAD